MREEQSISIMCKLSENRHKFANWGVKKLQLPLEISRLRVTIGYASCCGKLSKEIYKCLNKKHDTIMPAVRVNCFA